MKILISPAKSLDFDSTIDSLKCTQPVFLNKTSEINSVLKEKSPKDLMQLQGISQKLSDLNWKRNNSFKLPFNKENARPSIFTFNGDVYSGLDAFSLSTEKISRSQDSVRILSGLYGVLRPLDLIQAYRLEMGTKLSNDQGPDLYSFWRTKLTNSLNKLFQNSKNRYLINCSSLEYFKSIDLKLLNAKVITPIFKELHNGSPKIVSFFAKNARGAMTRFVVKNKIDRPEGLLDFNLDGYNYNKKLSEPDSPVFLRKNS